MAKEKIEIIQCQWFDDRYYQVIYTRDNKEITDYYPSTTTKLQAISKPGLIRWYGDIGTREAKKRTLEKGDRGSRIHHAVEIYQKGGAVIYQPIKPGPNYSQDEMKVIQDKYNGNVFTLQNQDEMLDVWKFKKALEILKPEIVGIEFIAYSHTYREAGTIDFLWNIKAGVYEGINQKPLGLPEGIFVSDLKTGSLYDEAKMQLSSYVAMAKEMNPDLNIAGGLIFHTGNTTKTGIPGLTVIYLTLEELREDYKDFRAVAQIWERQHKNSMPVLFSFPSLIALDKKE